MADESLTEVLKQFEDIGIKISIGDDTPKLLTNNAGIDFVRRKVGVEARQSRVDKDKMTGRMPPPDFYYGRVELRKPETWLRYAFKLLTSEPVRLTGSRSGRLDVEADRDA